MDTIQQFHWLDALVCLLMLVVSIGIGVFYGFCHVSKDTQDYLMGGRNMPLIPVAVSLIASFISGISIMGVPAETYTYGIHYLYVLIGASLSGIVLNYVFLPVFYDLQMTSVFEYLEKRFDARIRLIGTILFTFNMFTWLPIVTYVPALAINQFTGLNIYVISSVICIICIFYTSLGGIKAVVWTDVIQGFSMFGAMVVVAVKGTYDIGSFGVVWERNLNTTRIEPPDFTFDPFIRHSFWVVTIGGCVHHTLVSGINQTMFQRYMSLPDYKTVQKAVVLCILGIFFVFVVGGYCGFLMYATYHDCDPWSTQVVQKKEQILIVLVMKVMNDYPGLLGLFVAGILSATLSSLSTGLNSMAAVVVEDFYSSCSNKPLTERQASIIMKLTTVIVGVLCVLLILVVERLGAVLQLSITLSTIGNGPAIGIFTAGVLLPWIKSKGILTGGITSLILMMWINLRAQTAMSNGELVFETKSLRTDGCLYDFTPRNSTTVPIERHTSIYHISYLWYTLLGGVITIVVGFIATWALESLDTEDTDIQLLSPFIRKYFKKTQKSQYDNVHYKLNISQSDINGEKHGF